MRFFRWLIGYIDLNRELEEKDLVIADLQEQNAALLRQEGMAQRDHIEINRLYRELNEVKYGHSARPEPIKRTSPPPIRSRYIGSPTQNSYTPSRSSSSHSSTQPDITTSVVMGSLFSDNRNSDSCSPSSDSSSSSSSSDSGSSSCDSGSF